MALSLPCVADQQCKDGLFNIACREKNGAFTCSYKQKASDCKFYQSYDDMFGKECKTSIWVFFVSGGVGFVILVVGLICIAKFCGWNMSATYNSGYAGDTYANSDMYIPGNTYNQSGSTYANTDMYIP